MPNQIRLHRLTELREQVGLTLADMAACCGLQGTQSRKAASAWEAGTSIPRSNRRIPFVTYLWHDLQLHSDPTQFEEIWSILVEEWEWEPLSDDERAQLLVPLVTDTLDNAENHDAKNLVTQADGTSVGASNPDPLPSPSRTMQVHATQETDALAASPNLTAPPSDVDRSSWPLSRLTNMRLYFALIPLLLIAGFVGSQRWWDESTELPVESFVITGTLAPTAKVLATAAARVVMTTPVTPLPSNSMIMSEANTAIGSDSTGTMPIALHNGSFEENGTFEESGSFEESGGFDGWGLYEECGYAVLKDAAVAYDGVHYLSIHNDQPRCYSFYQDIEGTIPVSTTIHAALWLKSATGDARRGRLTLWALGGERETASYSFAVPNLGWTCVETALTIQQADHDRLRFEVYLDSHDGLAYHVDHATLSQGTEPLCPEVQLAIDDFQIIQPSGEFYPAATIGVQAIVQNNGESDLLGGGQIRYWVSETDNGIPLDPESSVVLTVPSLAVGESMTIEHYDLFLPINIPTEQQYFLVADVAMERAEDDYTAGFDRQSLPFTISPCVRDALYCDVPTDHWAHDEIVAWFDAGISQGCRSNTEPFSNRPFCPDSLVRRWMMVFFLMRRLEGADFLPTNEFQGLFADISEEFDHNQTLWIEAMVSTRVALDSDACPPQGERPRFCPADPLRRIDFIRALYELQSWDLTGIAGTHYADLRSGSLDARITEYMWQQGFLVDDDIACPASDSYPRFCPTAPLRRATAAVMMGRALGLVGPVP